ncbi:MAG: molybdate ABC transporter substrate-binding protein [Desulfocapsaceae bacterium]|nr:molybdate ABC transporter substrate-binding protein [Desulfocapsaceae bacterium]
MSVKIFMVLFLAMATLCGGQDRAAAETELLVSAASSLTDSFKEIGKAYETKNPGVTVRFNFAATGPLLQQIEQGAPVDVFASADQQSMDKAEKGKFILPGSRTDFTGNSLVLITPLNMTTVKKGLADLQSTQVLKISVGNPESVPVGRYTKAALEKQGVWEAIAPKCVMGSSVKQALEYVMRGEVEAGFVFATDAVMAKDKVRVVAEIPTVTPIVYPVAVVAGSTKKEQAQAFIHYLQGTEGQAVLTKYGFKKI